jgi:hypothetical protein
MLPAIRADEPQLICVFFGPDTRRIEGLVTDEKSKTILVPGGAVLSIFRIESQLCPGTPSQGLRESPAI